MNRRNFISNLGLASGGLLVKQFSPALAEKKVKIYDNYIRGLQYYQYDKLKSRLEPGQEIQLIREMENPYDQFAVQVFFKDQKLGYVAAYENIILANMLDAGVEIATTVSQHHPKSNDLFRKLAFEAYTHLIVPDHAIIQSSLTTKRADEAEDIYRGSF